MLGPVSVSGRVVPAFCKQLPAQSRQLSVPPHSSTPFYLLPELVLSRAMSAEIVNLILAEDLRPPTPSYIVSAVAAIFLNSFLKDKLP